MSQKILKTTLWFTMLSAFASGMNFLYYPVVSHLLPLAQFGDVQVGVSFIMLAASLFTSLNTLALFAIAAGTKKSRVIHHIERLVILISILGSAGTIIFAIPLSQALQLTDPSLLYILAAIFTVNIPAATWLGSLQGNGQFIASGWIAVISSVIKVIVSITAITLGLGAHGALLGIAIGTLAVLPLVRLLGKGNIIQYSQTFALPTRRDFSFFSKNMSIVVVLCSLIVVAVVSSLDVIFAKATLTPEQAGSYAQLSTAAKIPYFALLPLAIILFERFTKASLPIKRSFIYFAGIAVVVGFFTWALGGLILGILFNHSSAFAETVFPALLIAFVSYAIMTLAIYVAIVRRAVSQLAAASIITFGLTLLLLSLNHQTAEAIAQSFAASLTVSLLVTCGLQYTKRYE